MRKMMLWATTILIGFALLTTTFAQEARQNQKSGNEKMYLSGNNLKLENSAEITSRDIQIMWEKARLGMQTVDEFWQTKFARSGFAYRRPQVKYYTSSVVSRCGRLPMNNAVYCTADHTIYFDAVFFVRVMKAVGRNLGTDGDMAIIFILAHEWGHAAQGMMRMRFPYPMQYEENADCTAGAFTGYAAQQKWLEEGDLEEALTVLHVFGDELPYGAKGRHGSGEERMARFRRGLNGGLTACGGFNR